MRVSDLGVIASDVGGWPESLGAGPAITRVSDGDTIQLLDLEGVRHKIRLAKIDAPEADIAGLRELLAKYGLKGAEAPGDIEWNFTKFLIDRDGNVVKRFHPTTTPDAIANEIEPLLK